MTATLLFFLGLVLVIVAAELVVRAGTRLAAMLRVSPTVIGLTVVTLGTTSPELAVGITAAVEGRGELAVGNIAGTNILNLFFILGLSALIRPLPLQLLSIKLDLPVMVAAALALIAMSLDGLLGRLDGALLLSAAVVYTAVLVRVSRRESARVRQEFSEEYGPAAVEARSGPAQGARNGVLLVAGLAITVAGADLMVSGAGDIARALGVSDAVIGLTIVAIGTSAPELATMLVSTLRNQRDIAVGNLLGSSIYNILFILGATAVASSVPLNLGSDMLWIDLPLAAAAALLCVPVFASGRRIARAEGGLFVASYLIYLGSLVLFRT